MMSMAWKRSTLPSHRPPEITTERRSHMMVRHQKRKKPIHQESKGRKRSTSPRIDPKVKFAKATDHKANAGVAVVEAVVAVKAVAVVKAAVAATEATGQRSHRKSLPSSSSKKKRKLSRNLTIDLLRWIRMIDKYN
jgi:hypothetical protein